MRTGQKITAVHTVEPTPNPSEEGSGSASAREQFPSWEGSGVGRPEVFIHIAAYSLYRP